MPDEEGLWTLDEATAALSQVEALLREAQAAWERMREARAELDDLRIVSGGQAPADGQTAAEWQEHLARMEVAAVTLRQTLQGISDLEVEVKDLQTGLVDFRSRLGDQVVYLCWRRGEPRIGHWHTLEGGFAGRKALPRIDLD